MDISKEKLEEWAGAFDFIGLIYRAEEIRTILQLDEKPFEEIKHISREEE
jgi:hypothetical protein